MQILSVLVVCGLCFYPSVVSAEEGQRVIVVVGASGTDEYGQMFLEWASQWQAAAAAGDAGFVQIGGQPGQDDLAELKAQTTAAVSVRTTEPLWLVLIGHGTFDGRNARFNLQGKDLSAAQAADLLAPAQRPVAVINCTSCSSPFINALSGPDRTVITGTKDGSEIQFTRFGGYIAEAIGKLEADIDRDGQTSLLEAWLHAARATEEYYRSDGRLATEHSLLDDSGDGKGTRSESFIGVRIKDNISNRDELDGTLARNWHLVRSEEERSLTAEQRQRRNQLEQDLEELRQKKNEFSESEYLRQLEKILLPLAQLYDAAASDHAPTGLSREGEK